MEPKDIMDRVNALLAVKLSKQQWSDYLQKLLIVLIDLARNTEGDEFMNGFLTAAINDINSGVKPIMSVIEMPAEQEALH